MGWVADGRRLGKGSDEEGEGEGGRRESRDSECMILLWYGCFIL